jgi:hypothetical protein
MRLYYPNGQTNARIDLMPGKCTLLALVLTLLITGAAFAQSSAEFGRVSGGQIDFAVKAPSQSSGSLGLTMSRSNGLRGYGATLGGTVVKDRMWFFATADDQRVAVPTRYAPPATLSPSSFLSLRYTGIVTSNMFVTATVSRNSR